MPRGGPGALAMIAAALLGAGPAGAWDSHYLVAQAGGPFQGDASTGVDDVSVDKLVQVGVPGVDDGSYFSHAAANSDSGILIAESSIDPGPGVQSSSVTIASLEQWLDVEDVGNPITVRMLLDTTLSPSRIGVVAAEANARIDLGSLCGLYVSVPAVGDPEVVDNCTEEYPYLSLVASGGAGALHIEATYASGHLPTHIDLHAQVENEIDASYIGSEAGQALAIGALSIEVAGAGGHSFTSPTFLTAPEPEAGALAAIALASLAAARFGRHGGRSLR